MLRRCLSKIRGGLKRVFSMGSRVRTPRNSKRVRFEEPPLGLKSSIESLRNDFKFCGANFATGKKNESYPYLRNMDRHVTPKNSSKEKTHTHTHTHASKEKTSTHTHTHAVKNGGDHDYHNYSAIDALGCAPAMPIPKITFDPAPKFSAIDALEYDRGHFSNPLRQPEHLPSSTDKRSVTPTAKRAVVGEYVLGPDGWPSKSANMTAPRKPAATAPTKPVMETLLLSTPVESVKSNTYLSSSPELPPKVPKFRKYSGHEIMGWMTNANFGPDDLYSVNDGAKYDAYIRNNMNEPDPFRPSDHTGPCTHHDSNDFSESIPELITSLPRSDKAVHGASSIYHERTARSSKHSNLDRLTELYRRRCVLYRQEHRIRRMVLDLDGEIDEVEREWGRRIRIKDV